MKLYRVWKAYAINAVASINGNVLPLQAKAEEADVTGLVSHDAVMGERAVVGALLHREHWLVDRHGMHDPSKCDGGLKQAYSFGRISSSSKALPK